MVEERQGSVKRVWTWTVEATTFSTPSELQAWLIAQGITPQQHQAALIALGYTPTTAQAAVIAGTLTGEIIFGAVV